MQPLLRLVFEARSLQPFINNGFFIVYTLEEAAERFICALFEEIVDIATWEDDCVDDWAYYSSSYCNVYY